MISSEDEFVQAILQLRRDGSDSWDLEVKRATGSTPQLAETLCAFSNMPEGGTIIFGLDEASNFAAVGVHDPAALEQGIVAQARQQLEPQAQVNFSRVTFEGKELVVANVYGLPTYLRPCRVRASKKAYLRYADGDYVLSEQETQQMLSDRERPRHDIVTVKGATQKDLDPQLTEQFIRTARWTSKRLDRETDEQILRFKRVLEPTGENLTLAGLYALGKYPQQFLPSLSLTAVLRSSGNPEIRNADRQEFDGPLPEILDNAVQWVMRNTRTQVRFGADGHGYNETEVPATAIREIIANALVHRDLSQHTWGKDVQIILDDDQLLVTNPGGLWGLTTDQLGKENWKSAVNEFLYDICQLTTTSEGHRVIEGEGGGLLEARRLLQQVGLQEPQFYDTGVCFTVILPRHASPSDDDHRITDALQMRQRPVIVSSPSTADSTEFSDRSQQAATSSKHGAALWQALRTGPKDVHELSELTQRSVAQVRYGIRRLIDGNLIERTGGQGHRGTTYTIRTSTT